MLNLQENEKLMIWLIEAGIGFQSSMRANGQDTNAVPETDDVAISAVFMKLYSISYIKVNTVLFT